MTVVQFGIPRTGSTLVYRVLQEIFSDVEKCHNSQVQQYINKNINIVVSARHPIDSFLSYIRVVDFPHQNHNPIITMASVEKYLPHRITEHDQLTKILSRNKDLTLVLKYEKFYNDIPFICNKVSDFFNVKIAKRTDYIIKTCNLESTIKIQETMSSFKEHDPKSHVHSLLMLHTYSPHRLVRHQ